MDGTTPAPDPERDERAESPGSDDKGPAKKGRTPRASQRQSAAQRKNRQDFRQLMANRPGLPPLYGNALSNMLRVIYAMFIRDVKGSHANKRLGIFWLFIEPLVGMIVISAILIFIRHREIQQYDIPTWAVYGLSTWAFVLCGVQKSSGLVNRYSSLLIHRPVTVFSCILSQFLYQMVVSVIVFVIAFCMLLYFGFETPIDDPLGMLEIVVALNVMMIGSACIMSLIGALLPELYRFMAVFLGFLAIASGVIFPLHDLPPDVLRILAWNPLIHAVEGVRALGNRHYETAVEIEKSYLLACALISLTVGLLMQRRYRDMVLAKR